MKRLWLLFAQAVTVLLAAWLVVMTLKPQWLDRGAGRSNLTLQEAVSRSNVVAPGSLSPAARQAAPAVVSIATRQAPSKNQPNAAPWFRFFNDDGEDDEEPVQSGKRTEHVQSPRAGPAE